MLVVASALAGILMLYLIFGDYEDHGDLCV